MSQASMHLSTGFIGAMGKQQHHAAAVSCSQASSGGQVLLFRSDSSIIEQDIDESLLCCDEAPGKASSIQQQVVAPSPSATKASSSSEYGWRYAAAEELQLMISNAIERERELAPRLGYLDAPPPSATPSAPSGCAVPGAAAAAGMPTPSADAAVTPQMRAIVASWLSEVAAEFRMQQETLFLAVSLLDRFQAASPAGVPRNVLQLVAVAAVMLASKRDEVAHPTVDEFTEIAADAFKREDLLRMERLLLDQLEWRVAAPTAYSFLHLITQALAGRLPPRAIALAAYLCELALMDYAALAHPPSRIAAAAAAIAALVHRDASPNAPPAPAPAEVAALVGCAPRDLGPVAAQLMHLRQCAALADACAAYQPLAFVRDKYAAEPWVGISRHEPAYEAVAAALAALGLPPAVAQQLQQHRAHAAAAAQQQQQQHQCGAAAGAAVADAQQGAASAQPVA